MVFVSSIEMQLVIERHSGKHSCPLENNWCNTLNIREYCYQVTEEGRVEERDGGSRWSDVCSMLLIS